LRKFGRPRIIEQLRSVPRSVEQRRENARPSFSPRISVSFATLLDLSLHQGFHKYSPQEQIRAVLHVVATFPAMSKDDARFHINKAITIYAGEMRHRHKKKNDSDCQT
jgi:hypothetical protein